MFNYYFSLLVALCGVWEWQKCCSTCAPTPDPLPTYQILLLVIMNKLTLLTLWSMANGHSNCDLIALCANDHISVPLFLSVHYMIHHAKEVTFNASLSRLSHIFKTFAQCRI